MAATGRDLHVDKVLSNVAMGYRPSGFIADMILPSVIVQKQSDIYLEFDRARRLRRQDSQRSPGTEAHLVDQDVGSATYYARNYALKAAVVLEDQVNADPVFATTMIQGRVELLLDDLLLDKEIRVASKVTNTSNVGSYSAVSSAWNGSGDVLGDLNAAIDNVKYANGVSPRSIDVTFGLDAWDSARRDSTVRNLIFGNNNGGGYPDEAQMANLLGVRRVLVGGAFQNTGDEGQSENLQTIWGDNVLVAYTPERPTMERPSFGYEFRWAAPGLPNMQVERHPWNSRTKSEEIEVGYYADEKITGASYGFLLTAVNSST